MVFFPLVQSLDHVGPMARNVEDVELLWNALADEESHIDSLPKTIGYDPKYIAEADHHIQEQWHELLNCCKDMGISCIEVDLPNLDDLINTHIELFVIEASSYHLAHYGKYHDAYPSDARQGFDMALKFSVEDYVKVCTQRVNFTRQVKAVFEQVDVLFSPTLAVHEPLKYAEHLQIANQAYDYTLALVRHTCLFDHTGHPALAMPMKQSAAAVPASVQVIGSYGQESTILSFAKKLESELVA